MPTHYVPGTPNPYFPKHEFHGVPIYGNYQCVDDCKLHHYVGAAATVKHLRFHFRKFEQDLKKFVWVT